MVEFRLPPGLAEQARQFAAAGGVPVEPRLASTVVLMRPPFEVYLLRRVPTMAFAASMYVFPGGGVDPRDAAVLPDWAGPTPAQWAQRLRLEESVARSVVCAAVREVFEESGVLLAGADADTVVGDVSGADWERARLALIARETGFAEFLAGNGLVLRSDLLQPWSRWITPEFEPRRFDTYFFLAALPEGQVTRDVGGEADDTVWCAPAEAADGRFTMLPPTTHTLRELAAAGSIEAALAAAPDRDPADAIRPV
ncbi:NUDIX domain-containing protein [Dactylosporangium aurantiacum]|uniref:NUDIX domain-containing protein n=1 Tax=Dactylosporangium aurantiacum TaxID=35754 RepID=A0A9Q9MK23_9ACTN|nr:NUDIX domain-containing protein [Dactylosporangium aurantiacum]MDG6100662.1 NUDIX domain-containing protein [Dactylosporangium aurantiacum]UWZ55256.1 NUDIX domain-containing protein [Dactylosporangium aurantiacum]